MNREPLRRNTDTHVCPHCQQDIQNCCEEPFPGHMSWCPNFDAWKEAPDHCPNCGWHLGPVFWRPPQPVKTKPKGHNHDG